MREDSDWFPVNWASDADWLKGVVYHTIEKCSFGMLSFSNSFRKGVLAFNPGRMLVHIYNNT